MSETNYAKLPIFLVLDVSASMAKEGKFQAAFEFLPKLLSQLEDNAVVADKVRISVITFDEEAEVVMPMTERDGLRKWLDDNKKDPIEPMGALTRYAEAFRLLRQEIERVVTSIRREKVDDINEYKCFRPAVFFITDGVPFGEEPSETDSAFNALVSEQFQYRPIMICVGVGDAKKETLMKYSAGRYGAGGQSNSKYITGNSDLALVQTDGVTPTAYLKKIIEQLVQSIVSSTTNTQSDFNDDGMEEVEFDLSSEDSSDDFFDLD